MFDLNGCNLRYDLHQARAARITAQGWRHPSVGRGLALRELLAAALTALAARLAPAAVAVAAPGSPVATTPQP